MKLQLHYVILLDSGLGTTSAMETVDSEGDKKERHNKIPVIHATVFISSQGAS